MAQKRYFIWILAGMMLAGVMMAGCGRETRMEQYRAEKHQQDSIRLAEQVRSLAYYQSLRDSLIPVADSLMQRFTYERNEKYQDHGYYVAKSRERILVRDDGKEVLVYRDGKRVTEARDKTGYATAEHLQIVIRDIQELEQRMNKTSMEILKYEKRLKMKGE